MPSTSTKAASTTQQERQASSRFYRARLASPQQHSGDGWLMPDQTTAGAQAAAGVLTPHSSLASLASSMRSEGQLRQFWGRQTAGSDVSGREGLAPQVPNLLSPLSVSPQNSAGSAPSSDSSTVDFLRRSSSTSVHNLTYLTKPTGGRAFMTSPDMAAFGQWGGPEESMRTTMNSQTDHAEALSASVTNISQPSSPVAAPARSAVSQSGQMEAAMRGESGGGCAAPAVPMARAQSASFSGQPGRRITDGAGQGRPAPLQRRRRSRQHSRESFLGRSPGGGRAGQPLIPIRSGEVELFVRPQAPLTAGSFPEPVPEQVNARSCRLHHTVPLSRWTCRPRMCATRCASFRTTLNPLPAPAFPYADPLFISMYHSPVSHSTGGKPVQGGMSGLSTRQTPV